MSAVEEESFDETSQFLSHRRPSFLDQPIGSFKGANSLHNFASSFTRAQSFAAHKIDPDIKKKRSFFVSSPGAQDDELFDPDLMVVSPRGERLSTIIHDTSSPRFPAGASSYSALNDVFYQDDICTRLQPSRSPGTGAGHGIPISAKRVFPSPSFSSLRSSISYASTASHFGLKQVSDATGNLVTVVAGQSTAPQTLLNSVNILIGVGLLALPVGLLKAGWALGFPLLVACCLVTCWTGSLISKALDTDPTMMTYADLGYASYGSTAKLLISVIFSADLMCSGVSLILLFSDSLYALVGDDVYWTKTMFKIVAFFVLTPFTFMPLTLLSVISLFGIMATISIVLLVVLCGFLKSASPGSLVQAMPTNMWPDSIPALFIALGILMAPFGGHAVFPNLKADMRHPEKFTKTVITTYTVAGVVDCSMAVIGFLMFGALCNNEVTSILLETAGYPQWIYPLISGLICIVPLAKTPLNAKPIISTLDGIFKLDVAGDSAWSRAFNNASRFSVRIAVNAMFVGFAILFPEFDKIVGILGSSICFIVCIILPCAFYLKLCKDTTSLEQFCVHLALWVSVVLACICTHATLAY